MLISGRAYWPTGPVRLGLINNSRNSFQNKVGGQKSAFFEISIEIKSAQPVCCYEAGPFGSKLAADELVGRPGASDAHAELQQALSGLRPTAHQPCHGSAVAPLLGFRREWVRRLAGGL